MHEPSLPQRHFGSDLIFLTLFFCALFFILLGSRPLLTPDEGRYAEIAREMAASGDYITPHLNYIKYFEKPALFYWLGAIAIKIGGVNIISVRLINALIALFGCLLTYATARQLYGRAAGIIASLVLGTSTLYFVMAHMVSLDLPVTVFISASLYGFILAAETRNPVYQRRYLWGAAAAAALAVLTKGLIGLVFPGMIVFVWMATLNKWHLLLRLPLFSSLILFLLIVAPWHILVQLANPEFFQFYFIEQHFLRYTTMDIGHYQPVWFFIPTLLAGFFPWIVFLPQAIVHSFDDHKDRASELFFVIAAAMIFCFFSFSKSKLIPYILPVLPPLAILTGRYLALRLNTPTRWLQTGYLFLVILTGILDFYLWNLHITVTDPLNASLFLRAALLAMTAGSVLSFLAVRFSPRTALGIIMLSSALFLILAHGAVRYIDTRTIRPLALIIKPLLKPTDEVITYNQYYQDLPFYLERRITILNWRNELTFGMSHQATAAWMINTPEFLKRWHSKHRIYMIMSQKEFELFHQYYPRETIILLKETPTNVLVTNYPLVFSLT